MHSVVRLVITNIPLRFPTGRTLITPIVSQNRLYSIRQNDDNNHSTSTPLEESTVDGTLSTTTGNSVPNTKLIKVAVIGAPNAGKSSFINQFTKRSLCPTSRKVHTTQTFSQSICTQNKAQMVLFDTPGMVTSAEMKKHKLSQHFVSSCRHSIQQADLIAVVHDVSNSHTRNELNATVLETLQMYETLPSILVLNKVDMLHSKRILLDLVRLLTEKTLVCHERRYSPWNGREKEFMEDMERPVKYKNEKSVGWPRFSEVFMVSSLTGDGLPLVRQHLEKHSIVKPWEYTKDVHTDQPMENLIVDSVRAVLLDYLPNEIPYNLGVEMEYLDKNEDRIFAYVNIVCPSERIQRLLCGGKCNRIKQITETANSELIKMHQFSVALVIRVITAGKPKEAGNKNKKK